MKHYLTIALLLVTAAAFGQPEAVHLQELRDMYSLSDRLPITTTEVRRESKIGEKNRCGPNDYHDPYGMTPFECTDTAWADTIPGVIMYLRERVANVQFGYGTVPVVDEVSEYCKIVRYNHNGLHANGSKIGCWTESRYGDALNDRTNEVIDPEMIIKLIPRPKE